MANVVSFGSTETIKTSGRPIIVVQLGKLDPKNWGVGVSRCMSICMIRTGVVRPLPLF